MNASFYFAEKESCLVLLFSWLLIALVWLLSWLLMQEARNQEYFATGGSKKEAIIPNGQGVIRANFVLCRG